MDSVVARHEGKYWKVSKNKGNRFRLLSDSTEASPTLPGFTQQCPPVVLMAQCDYLQVEKRDWKIM